MEKDFTSLRHKNVERCREKKYIHNTYFRIYIFCIFFSIFKPSLGIFQPRNELSKSSYAWEFIFYFYYYIIYFPKTWFKKHQEHNQLYQNTSSHSIVPICLLLESPSNFKISKPCGHEKQNELTNKRGLNYRIT